MVDQIGIALKSVASDIIPFYLYEAEEDNYPYAVYFYTPEFFSTKDGVYKIATNLTVQVYSNDSDDALEKSDALRSAILTRMNTGKFFTRLSTTSKECVERVWKIETVFRIIQIS